MDAKCAICHKAKDEHIEGISGILGCHNNSSSTTYEPETKPRLWSKLGNYLGIAVGEWFGARR